MILVPAQPLEMEQGTALTQAIRHIPDNRNNPPLRRSSGKWTDRQSEDKKLLK